MIQLEERGYKYDFCPLGVSGCLTDNGAPNEDMGKLVQKWNELYGDKIEVRITTLEDFFSRVEREALPVYKGDFTDWWADGVQLMPNAVMVFREAQRMFVTAQNLNKALNVLDEKLVDECAYALIMFAEHTWGYLNSIWEPH